MADLGTRTDVMKVFLEEKDSLPEQPASAQSLQFDSLRAIYN